MENLKVKNENLTDDAIELRDIIMKDLIKIEEIDDGEILNL